MTVAVVAQDRINELAETEEIKKLRKFYREENKSAYERKGIEFLGYVLSSICAQYLFVGEEAERYFKVLDARNFLLEKYKELPDAEAINCREEIEDYLEEADEELEYLESEILDQ